MNNKYDVPDGYALISIDALKAWGKYDEVRNACQFPADQAEQEPVACGIDWGKDSDQSCVSIIKKHPNGTSEVVAVEYSEHPVSQEPVAIADGTFNHNCPLGTPLYAAPVRTKDLTDQEIDHICARLWSGAWRKTAHRQFARAVIAAYKEKNSA